MASSLDYAGALGFKGGQDGHDSLVFLGETAYAWFYLGQHDAARRIFEALAMIAPRHPAGALGLAQVALAMQQYRQAMAYSNQALRLPYATQENMATGYLYRGDAQIGLKNAASAVADWQRSCETGATAGAGALARHRLEKFQTTQPQACPPVAKRTQT